MGAEPAWYRLPLCHGQVFVSSRGADAIASGFSLTSPCNSKLLTLESQLLTAARGRFPIGILARSTGLPMVIEGPLTQVLAAVSDQLGEASGTAVATARQAQRPHFVSIVNTPQGRVFIKSTTDEISARREIEMLGQMDGGTAAIRVPKLLASGVTGGNYWFASEAMPAVRHAPVWNFPDLDIEHLVAKLGENSDGSHPAHGDLAPWNLRVVAGQVWLIDWADSWSAPLGYDRAYFESAAIALGSDISPGGWQMEAVSEVTKVVQARIDRGPEPLDLKMRDALLRRPRS